MKIEQALEILGLNTTSTLNELNSSFRKLAKKFHPDFHRGNESWAHKNMIELNLAYEVALDFFTDPNLDKVVGRSDLDQQKPVKKTFFGEFNRAINQILKGIYIYYQYGLENVHLRGEGVRKLRYRDSLSCIKSGVVRLTELKGYAGNKSDTDNLTVFTDFSKAFLQNMLIEKYYIPSDMPSENNAYQHYYNGSSLLDYAIKEVFFGDSLIQFRRGSFSNKLSISYNEFMVVVTRYYESSWIVETFLKIYLLELFTKVIRLLKGMRH